MEDIQKLTQLGNELQKGLVELQGAHKQLKNETDAMVEQKITRIAEDMATKYEELQAGQAKLSAVLERAGKTDDADEKDARKAEKSALLKFMRRGAASLDEKERAIIVAANDEMDQKGLSTDSNPDGGYLVPVGTFGMIQARLFETSPMRRIATVRPTTFKSVTADLDDDEADVRWEGEGDSSGETDTPEIGQIEIATRKLEAEPRATVESLQDAAFDLESWLVNKVTDKFGRMENTAFVTGNTPLRPRGFLTYGAIAEGGAYERNKIEQVVNGSTSAVTESGLIRLHGSLKEPYQARAVTVMKRSTLVGIMLLKGVDSYRFLNLQPVGPAGQTGQVLGASMMLLEKPVVLMDDMPVVASGALPVAYGDFSKGYTIVDRVGVSVLRDPYTAKGRIKFYTTKRTGGAVTNFEAIKILKASVS